MDTYNQVYRSLKTLELEPGTLSEHDRLCAVNGPLLDWFHSHARVLPWRENPEGYRVWVSEIMLQQTRVEAVKPYFERFLDRCPDIRSLAEADEETLLKLWEGLGYYNRVRNLNKAAVRIQEEFDGIMPSGYEELLSLPGIGSYTAGAIASIAFNQPVPAVDGNVLRVLSRVLGSREDIGKPAVKKRFEALLAETMDQQDCSSFNQGLIEVGALVCVPNGQPKCGECPLHSICLAKLFETWTEIPVKAPKKPRRVEERQVFLFCHDGKAAIRKRPPKGLLASLYEFPNREGELGALSVLEAAEAAGVPETEVEAVQDLGQAKHVFSHVEWHMRGYLVMLREESVSPGDCIFVTPGELEEKYPLPNAFLAYKNAFAGT